MELRITVTNVGLFETARAYFFLKVRAEIIAIVTQLAVCNRRSSAIGFTTNILTLQLLRCLQALYDHPL